MVTEKNMDRGLEVFDRVSKILASMESFAGDINLSKIEMVALVLISKEGDLIMSKLAGGLGVKLSTATGIVDRLIDKKLVKREKNHGDRRVVKIALTAKGAKAALAHQKQKKETFKKMMNVLTREEQEDFLSIWQKIADTWSPTEGLQ